ncbi:MAG TPA: NAD(P)H-quinone oxidoreductase [bacterium]|nr:NAD(P)H-quinone oxidoreductase [bacterium]
MRAILVDKNKELVCKDIPEPEVKDNEVLIEVHAIGINRADLMQRDGEYPSPAGWPDIMGLEVAGIVLSAPSQSRWKKGDKVCALLGGGGYAEKVSVPVNMVLPVPEGLSMAQASAIPEIFATSWLNLCIEGKMKHGETVLIQSGASGVGTAAIQIVKAFGGKVITTVGSDKKVEFVRSIGADIIVNREKEDLLSVLEKYPVDISLDCIAGPSLGKCIEKMAQGGRWIVIATLGGIMTEINMNIFFKKGIRIIGSTLRNKSTEMKGKILADMESALWPKFSSGDIKPVIYKILPIDQVSEAHAILERRENLGKVVLTISE